MRYWPARNMHTPGRNPGGIKLRARINEILYNALVRLFSRVGGQKSLGYVLLWIGVCAAAIFIAYWIFRTMVSRCQSGGNGLASRGRPFASWQEWIFAAREAAGHGDYRMAIHCAYWAGIARFRISARCLPIAQKPRANIFARSPSPN